MRAKVPLLLLALLLPAMTVAQNSYNRWEARPPDPIVPLPHKRSTQPTKPAPETAVRAVPDSAALTTGGYRMAEVKPMFPGGTQALLMALQRNLKRPAGSRQRGAVLVQFTVSASGTLSGIGVVPGRGLNPAYDAAAVAAVSRVLPFTPGKRGGQPVDMVLTVPVEFR